MSSPPSAALWGGWYANILDMSTFSTPAEQDVFLREHPLVQVLSKVEQTTTMEELWSVVRDIDEQSVMQLNSPLLDDLRKVALNYGKDPPSLGFMIHLAGSIHLVLFFLGRCSDPRAYQDGALRMAASKGCKDICTLLLDRGADVHAVDDYSLRYAALYGHKDVCALLLDRGADVHAWDDSPLRWAASSGHKDVCELLLNRGASHADAVRYAATCGHKDVVDLLLQSRSTVSTTVSKNG